MIQELRKKLIIPNSRLESINRVLLDPDSRVINDFLEVVARYGTPEKINRQATGGSVMRDVAIIGAGQSAFSRKCGISIRELCFDAFKEAMEPEYKIYQAQS